MEAKKIIEIEDMLNNHYVGAKINSHIYLFRNVVKNSRGDRIKNIARNSGSGVMTAFIKFNHVRGYINFPFEYLDDESKELIYKEMFN